MNDRKIPQELIEKYGEDILRGGLAAADHRRREYSFNHQVTRLAPEPETTPESAYPLPSDPALVKIWPNVILAAITNKHGGAARVWVLAKSIDQEGSGRVTRSELRRLLDDLKIGGRKRRRWLRDALKLGLLREVIYRNGEVVYKLVSWGRGAGRLGCSQMGSKPAYIPMKSLVLPGWRAHVWAGYLTTLEGKEGHRIISQETKYKLTGIDPRTQRNYQAALGIERRQNYSNIDQKRGYLEGHIFYNEKTEKAVQKFPDIFIVPIEIARNTFKGRTRKAQREINSRTLGENSSNSAAGSNDNVIRLFHETKKGAESALKRLDTFGEAFWCKHAWENANQWGVLVQL